MMIIDQLADLKISRWVRKGSKLQASSFRLISDRHQLEACGLQPVAIYSGGPINNKIGRLC
jgi:hypothetical protein